MVSSLFSQVFGFAVLVGILSAITRAHSRRWRRLSDIYAADGWSPKSVSKSDTQKMQTIFLESERFGWVSYKGIVTVTVTERGLLLSLFPIFALHHPPLLIPFGDLDIQHRRWYLIGKTYQLRFKRVASMKMIIHSELLDWIESRAKLLVADETRFASCPQTQSLSIGDDVA